MQVLIIDETNSRKHNIIMKDQWGETHTTCGGLENNNSSGILEKKNTTNKTQPLGILPV